MTEFIVCFDTETTGLDVQHDWIIQLSFVKFRSVDFVEVDHRDWYILPSGSYSIAPSAEAVHHISREKLESDGVSLRSVYPEMMAFVEGCDMLSYNGNGFDTRILYYNLQREGLSFDFDSHTFYDSYIIETARTSRRLGDVYRRYYGHDFEGAHNSLADVRATIDVFRAQYESRQNEQEIERAEFDFISLDGFLALQDGQKVFAQGKHRGETIEAVLASDPSYIDWVCTKCEPSTRRLIDSIRHPQNAESCPPAAPAPKNTESHPVDSCPKNDSSKNAQNPINPEPLPKVDPKTAPANHKEPPHFPTSDTQTSLF